VSPDADLQQKLKRIADLEASQREPLPRPFGPYLLVSSIARGGMGEVFLARSGGGVGLESLQKHCVVKTLRPHLTDDREYVTRFLDEARVVVQLNHRNICHVFDVGLVGERYYLAMELVAGQDLRALADATGPMDPALAVHIIAETLEALDYAHRLADVHGAPLKLVHRDVSPQNIMVSYEGEVKLIDFGLAQSAVKVEKTSPQTVMGKLAYMSPEQLRGEPATKAIDLFAVAVVLTELLLGARFYGALGAHETWLIAARGDHRPAAFSTIEPGLRAILDRALAATASTRFPDALAFRAALLAWRTTMGLWADAPTLRAEMHQRFAADEAAHRERLQRVAGLTVPPPATPTPSQSLARAPSPSPSPSPSATPVPPARLDTAAEETGAEETAAVVALALPSTTSRRWPFAAAVVATVLVALGFVVRLAPSGGADDRAAVVELTPPPPPLSVVVSPPPDPPPPAPSPPPVVAQLPPPSVPALAATEGKPATGAKRPKAKPSSLSTAPAPSPVPPASASATTLRWDDTPPRERVNLLQQRCPKLPCVADLAARRVRWASLGVAEMRSFTVDLEACRSSCSVK
jgi:serine/threonine-protein kinase